ncbi:MAG: helix-hairpin-helix domain-containing protein [Crocinitomicaceae bacterium]
MNRKISVSRIQKIGIASFAVVIVALVIILNVNSSSRLPDVSETTLAGFEFSSQPQQHSENTSETEIEKNALSYFNPNNLDEQGWENIGFSQKQAQAIVKYRSSYGPFKTAEDVSKIYVISDDKYKEIAPFMIFEKQDEDVLPDTSINDAVVLVDVNTATAELLQEINGIGPTYSERIVKFRNSLGGFYSKDQFDEVYGISEESLAALKKRTTISEDHIDKIKINSISKSDLKRHPYFKKWEVVSAILSKRDKERITSLSFLVDDNVVGKAELEKMEAYVSYE